MERIQFYMCRFRDNTMPVSKRVINEMQDKVDMRISANGIGIFKVWIQLDGGKMS